MKMPTLWCRSLLIVTLALASGCINYPPQRQRGSEDRERRPDAGSSGGDGHDHQH